MQFCGTFRYDSILCAIAPVFVNNGAIICCLFVEFCRYGNVDFIWNDCTNFLRIRSIIIDDSDYSVVCHLVNPILPLEVVCILEYDVDTPLLTSVVSSCGITYSVVC